MEKLKIQVLTSHQEKLRADLAEIDCERDRLNAEREVVSLQLSAVEKQLQTSTQIAIVGQGFDAPPAKSNGALNLKGMGFREALRTVLGAEGARGMRPKDIADGMRAGNFEYKGNVHLSARVSNELYNLKKTGKILRRQSGLYHLKPEGS